MQYKTMYPTLEVDIDGELEKLKVSRRLPTSEPGTCVDGRP